MRLLRLLVLLFLVPLLNAQNTNRTAAKTEAEQDGFSGPVRSVRMLSDSNPAPWVVSRNGARRFALPSPYVFMLVASITCRVCDYDEEGHRTRSGQFITTSNDEKLFVGSEIAIVRDPARRMVERTVTDASTGKLITHDWFGPFGITKSLLYRDGKPSGSKSFTYDSAGHMTELVGRDADGNVADRMTTTFNQQGQWIYRGDFGSQGELRWSEAYDRLTDTQHHQHFDDSGNLTSDWIVTDNQIVFYWSATDVPGRNDGLSTEYFPGQDVYQFRCQNNGDCETFRIHYEYLNDDYNLPAKIERHDASGAVIDAVYIAYSVDEHRNWTTRKVWIVSADIPQRTLYETDARSITYWPN